MAYNKRIRGNDNVASEEFSHNRIFVDLGISGLIFSLFAVLLITSAVIWMVVRNGSLLSVLIILTFLAVFFGGLIVGLCFIAVTISKTIQQVQVNKILAQTVVAGEIVAYRNSRDEWDHLSAEHERAKVIPQLTVSAAEHEPLPSEAYTVLDMHRQGIGFKAIAEATQWTEYAVRKLCNQVDGKGGAVIRSTTPPASMCTQVSISVNQSITQSRNALQAISRNRLIDITQSIGPFLIEIGLFLREKVRAPAR